MTKVKATAKATPIHQAMKHGVANKGVKKIAGKKKY